MDINITSEEIYHILEEEIVSLQIKPGEALSENRLCKRFGVSRTPIRSALQALQQEHFLHIIPYKGTIVKPIDLDIVNQVIYQRVAVETMVFRDFVKNVPPTLVEKTRYALQMLKQVGEKSWDLETFHVDEFLQKDLEMHEIWFRHMEKMFLWENMTRPQADYSRFIRLDIVGAKNVVEVIADHEEMMRLIDEKNIAAIEPLMQHHLYGGIRRLSSQLFSEEYEMYFMRHPN